MVAVSEQNEHTRNIYVGIFELLPKSMMVMVLNVNAVMFSNSALTKLKNHETIWKWCTYIRWIVFASESIRTRWSKMTFAYSTYYPTRASIYSFVVSTYFVFDFFSFFFFSSWAVVLRRALPIFVVVYSVLNACKLAVVIYLSHERRKRYETRKKKKTKFRSGKMLLFSYRQFCWHNQQTNRQQQTMYKLIMDQSCAAWRLLKGEKKKKKKNENEYIHK